MTRLATHTTDGRVARIELNRPEQRNALSTELLADLHRAFDEVAADDAVHVVVLAGAGRAFCAGMDLKEVVLPREGEPGDRDVPRQLLTTLVALCQKIRLSPKVVVAEVNGAAIGGGCGLACVCDVCVSHEGAKLGYPEVDLGLCPAVVAPWLVRKIGPGRARAVLLQGGVMDAARAHELGIVDVLAPDRDGLAETSRAVVESLASGGARALAATKGLLNELDGSTDATLGERGAALSAQVLATPEAQDALRARMH